MTGAGLFPASVNIWIFLQITKIRKAFRKLSTDKILNAFLYDDLHHEYSFFCAPHFGMVPQTLPLQLTQPRHPYGTQELLLSAATFLS